MLVRFGVMGGKIFLFIFFFMWVRWSIPQYRFDQLMRLAWHSMVPMSLGLVALTTVLVYFAKPVSVWATIGNIAIITFAIWYTSCFAARR